MMEDKVFGESGSKVVIEEFLTGPEVSVLSFTDGKTLVPMVSSMDHKRALDGDKGIKYRRYGNRSPKSVLYRRNCRTLYEGNLPADHGSNECRRKNFLQDVCTLA